MTPERKRKTLIAALVWIAAIVFCALSAAFYQKPESAPAPEARPFAAADGKIRICFWNLKNYMDTYRYEGGRRSKGPKPESEKRLIAEFLKKADPDVLGVAEMGGLAALKEFRGLLAECGLDYPYHAISEDNPEYPQCAILSRIPIENPQTLGKGLFEYRDEMRSSPRGLTAATFTTNGLRWRFGVIHLKSRFGARKYDPEFSAFRTLECRAILRDIGQGDAPPALIVGDFNDEISDAAPQVFVRNGGFVAIAAADACAKKPSYVWDREKKPYVFDFFIADKRLAGRLSPAETGGINRAASDHAPVLTELDVGRDSPNRGGNARSR